MQQCKEQQQRVLLHCCLGSCVQLPVPLVALADAADVQSAFDQIHCPVLDAFVLEMLDDLLVGYRAFFQQPGQFFLHLLLLGGGFGQAVAAVQKRFGILVQLPQPFHMVAQLKQQRRTGSGQIAFYRHQHPLCGRTLVSCHGQNGPHGPGDIDGTAGAVQGVDAAHLVHVRHDQHGAFGALAMAYRLRKAPRTSLA